MKPIGIIITDTHLHKDNIDQVKDIFRQTIELCLDRGIKKIFHAGDIFTSRTGQPLAVLLAWHDILEMVGSKLIEMIAIPGNHDKTDLESENSFLDPFSSHLNFNVFTKQTLIFEDKINICMLPYFKETGSYLDKLSILNSMIETQGKKVNILITHTSVTGVRNNDGSQVDGPVSSDLFKKFHSVFVGHYHNKQKVGNNIYYIGSSHPQNYGEDNDKGVTVLNDDGSHEFIKLSFPEYHKYEINIEKLDAKTIKQLKEEKNKSNDNIRIILTGDSNKLKSFDRSLLLDIGLDCKLKSDEVVKQVESAINDEFISFDQSGILGAFKEFCKENKLKEKEGLKYLTKIYGN
jgi:exonuclease SbcD